MASKANRKEKLIAAYQSGDFLDAVYKSDLAEPDEREDLPLEIAALHNDDHINVVAEFAKLDNKQESGPDFFTMRRVFEKTLPHIDASMRDVMRCVLHLYQGAGQDMAAGTVFNSYIAYCEKNPARPLEAMQIIEDEHDQFADILPSTVAAGSRIDNPHYLAEVLRLSRHPAKVLRRRAVFSLARIEWPKEAKMPEEALAGLEKSVTEVDDEILASVIKSAFTFYQQDKTTEARVTALIDNALSKGNECALHAGAEIFGFETKEIPAPLLDLILRHLKHVKPANKGTINNIDFGITSLLKEAPAEKAICFLEELLLQHTGTVTTEAFGRAANAILTNKTLLSRVTTRWLLNGAPALCESVEKIVRKSHNDTLLIDIDTSELPTKDFKHIVFVARKAVGYLFTKPITATSILISLMRLAPDDETPGHLGELLFDSLLINYPGSVLEYVEAQARRETGKVKATLDKALAELTAYLETLSAVPVLAALHPSQAHREACSRYTGELFAASMQEAEKHSVFRKFALNINQLYGRKFINYVHGGGGPPRRMETPMKSYSGQMEFPRMEHLDQYGLNYMLHVFRAERWRT